MRKLGYLIFILMFAAIAYGVDKTYKASSGDLILDASDDVVVNTNLGIGNTEPSYNLDLSTSNPIQARFTSSTLNNNTGVQIDASNTGSPPFVWFTLSNASYQKSARISAGSDGSLGFYVNGNHTEPWSPSTAMVISPTGNLTLGTTSSGTTTAGVITGSSGNAVVAVERNGSSRGEFIGTGGEVRLNAVTGILTVQQNSDERIRIDSNVIRMQRRADQTPLAMLHVRGCSDNGVECRAQKLIGNINGTAANQRILTLPSVDSGWSMIGYVKTVATPDAPYAGFAVCEGLVKSYGSGPANAATSMVAVGGLTNTITCGTLSWSVTGGHLYYTPASGVANTYVEVLISARKGALFTNIFTP